MERIYVLDKINIDTDMFLVEFSDAAKLLINEEKRLKKEGWRNIQLQMEYYIDWTELKVVGYRLENDKEYNLRLEQLKAEQVKLEKKKQKEYERYLKLKEKFEL